MFSRLPYDSTYTLEAFLDCVEFLTMNYFLDVNYMVNIVQLGFGFRQKEARWRWVTTLENLLYNYNVQCKFMMPCKHAPPALKHVARYSNLRAPYKDDYMPMNSIYSPETKDLNKNWLMILFRYFSMGTSIDSFGKRHMVDTDNKRVELALW